MLRMFNILENGSRCMRMILNLFGNTNCTNYHFLYTSLTSVHSKMERDDMMVAFALFHDVPVLVFGTTQSIDSSFDVTTTHNP
jgi:hypothetical protein